MAIRKISEITLDDIKNFFDQLPTATANTILREKHLTDTLIVAARSSSFDDLNKLSGIGPQRAQEIKKALANLGFVLEESRESDGLRRMLVDLGIIKDFGTTEEYESRTIYTPEQITQVCEFLTEIASPLGADAIIMHYGLDGNGKQILYFFCRKHQVPFNEAKAIESQAKSELNHPENIQKLQQMLGVTDRRKAIETDCDKILNEVIAYHKNTAPSIRAAMSGSGWNGPKICGYISEAGIKLIKNLEDISANGLRQARGLSEGCVRDILTQLDPSSPVSSPI